MLHDAPFAKRSWRGAAVTASLLMALTGLALPAQTAYADDDLTTMSALQAKVQETTQAYNDANDQVNSLQTQIDANEDRIAQIEAQMPILKDRASDSIRILYKMQQGQGSLIDLIFSSEDFNDLIATIQYLDAIQAHNTGAVSSLAETAAEYEQAREDLQNQMSAAEQARQDAADAMQSAEDARSAYEAQIEAQAAAEAAQREAAIEQAKQEAAQQQTFQTQSGETTQVVAPQSPDAEEDVDVDLSLDRDAYISSWGKRIDAYLAGSPLAGQGKTFAAAAYDSGVDPRFSPAIAAVESSKGANCFNPYNAWGWGSASWSSWEAAIAEHVAGLASGYGGTLTLAGAKKYCPPNAYAWYASVLANMEQI